MFGYTINFRDFFSKTFVKPPFPTDPWDPRCW